MADLLELTTEIVTAHVRRNAVEGGHLRALIESVYDALAKASSPEEPARVAEPVVPIKRSVFDDHIVCLMCGKDFRTLKRHLKSDHGLTIDDYRARFGLPHDYPMLLRNTLRLVRASRGRPAWGARAAEAGGRRDRPDATGRQPQIANCRGGLRA